MKWTGITQQVSVKLKTEIQKRISPLLIEAIYRIPDSLLYIFVNYS